MGRLTSWWQGGSPSQLDLFWNRFCLSNAADSLIEAVVSSTTVDCDTSVNSLSISSSSSSTPSASAPSAFSPASRTPSSLDDFVHDLLPTRLNTFLARSSLLLDAARLGLAFEGPFRLELFGGLRRVRLQSRRDHLGHGLRLICCRIVLWRRGGLSAFSLLESLFRLFFLALGLGEGFSLSFMVSYCRETHPVIASWAVGLSLRLRLRSLLRLRSRRLERSLLERSLDLLREAVAAAAAHSGTAVLLRGSARARKTHSHSRAALKASCSVRRGLFRLQTSSWL